MWIVQEFLSARELVFASGSIMLPWEHVQHIFPTTYGHRDLRNRPPALTLVNERRHHIFRQKHGVRPDLYQLIQQFGLLHCSDLRDRVFALSGLFQESSKQAQNVLIVDYSLSPAQLLVKVLLLVSESIKFRENLKKFDD
jgi:hypothetical protein